MNHQEIKQATDEILAQLTKERMAEVPFRRGGVNWADLKCCDVHYIKDLYGDQYWHVIIDEVSPDETELQEYVGDALREKGLTNFDVITEW